MRADDRHQELDDAFRRPSGLAAVGLLVFAGVTEPTDPVVAGLAALPLGMWLLHYLVMARWFDPFVRACVSQSIIVFVLTASIFLTGGPTSLAIVFAPIVAMMLLIVFPGARPVAVVAPSGAVLAGATGERLPDFDTLGPSLVLAGLFSTVAVVALASVATTLESDARARSVVDPLTGALNRRAFENRALELEAQASVARAAISIVSFDLDHFKRINDTHGHPTGDAVLRAVAYEARKALRSYERLYRLGGEEFVIVLAGADGGAARRLAERVRRVIDAELVPGVAVSASFGIATCDGDHVDLTRLLDDADRALYDAKRAGRNRCVHVDDEASPTPEVAPTPI